MPGEIQSNLEQEIALLEREIQSKRQELEKKSGMVIESREALHHLVGEKLGKSTPSPGPSTTAQAPSPSSGAASYLDNLDPASVAKVNDLIGKVSKQGIAKTIEEARRAEPFILDAFHDALVDKLHGELKARGLVK